MQTRQAVEHRVELGGAAYDFVSSETAIVIGWPGFLWAASYRRPLTIETDGDGPVVPITDHVMILRLVVFAGVVLLSLIRRLRS